MIISKKFGAHGALRPTNIVVLPDVLKVTGLPHFQGLPRRPLSRITQNEAGKVAYLAPEVRKDDQPIDVRADVYSIGVILGELLTGVVHNPKRYSSQHAMGKACRRSPDDLAAVLTQALAPAGAAYEQLPSSLRPSSPSIRIRN
ncbi:MAG: hypothetical protein R3C68_05605 [Myxococcota bacterium]